MSAAPSFGIESSATTAGLGKSVVVKGRLLSGEDLTIEGEVEGTIEVLERRRTIAVTGRADRRQHIATFLKLSSFGRGHPRQVPSCNQPRVPQRRLHVFLKNPSSER